MKILFLGDVVGVSGCSKIKDNLLNQIKIHNINFVIINAENADQTGAGLTKEICEDFFKCGVNVITTGNHVWDQKEIMNFIDKENRLLRPKNLFEPAPGKGFEAIELLPSESSLLLFVSESPFRELISELTICLTNRGQGNTLILCKIF